MIFRGFEHRHERLAPVRVFLWRLARNVGLGATMIAVALVIGVLGYHWSAGFGWIDAFLEASMILGGMGPVNQLPTDGAKIFASIYALFSGLIFIGVMGVVLAPVMHRLIHKFHLEEKGTEDSSN